MIQFIKVLQIGWNHAQGMWSRIAPIMGREFLLELEGGQMEWAESAKETWHKQEELYSNQWKKLVRFTARIRKGAKAEKESLSKKKMNRG